MAGNRSVPSFGRGSISTLNSLGPAHRLPGVAVPYHSALAGDTLPFWSRRDVPVVHRYRDPLSPPERAVTIAVGFRCVDGIVIASDTQYTRGPFKTEGPKIFTVKPPARQDLALLIAGAGHVAFMKRAIEQMESALSSCSANLGVNDVKVIIEDELLTFFTKHVYPIPSYEGYGFELLIAVWTKQDGFGLFKTTATTISAVATREVIGCGFDVVEYVLNLLYLSPITVEDATFVAVTCVKAAKDYVDYCGGKTNAWTMKDGPVARIKPVPPPEVNAAERHSKDVPQTSIRPPFHPTENGSHMSPKGTFIR